MQKICRTLACFACLAFALTGCQSGGTGALDLQGYPNINVVPTGEIAPLTPQQEYEMLAELNSALAAQPQLSPEQRALYVTRQQRLAEIAATHAIDTTRIIEAR